MSLNDGEYLTLTVDNLHQACTEDNTNTTTGTVYGLFHTIDALPLIPSSIYIKTFEFEKNAIIDFEEF
jgi:hypothetical protein